MGMARLDLVWRSSKIFKMATFLSVKTFLQFLSYALIGVLTNSLGYVVYFILTYFWGSPKLTMTVLYIVGAVIAFYANRNFTFKHDGKIGVAGARYIFAQFAGYLLNLVLLLIFVDWLGFAHQVVQAIAIIVVAIFLFLVLRIFVFPSALAVNGVVRQ